LKIYQEIPEELTVTIKTMGDSGTGQTFLLSLSHPEVAQMVKHLSRLPGLTSQQRTTLLNYLMRTWGRILTEKIRDIDRMLTSRPFSAGSSPPRR